MMQYDKTMKNVIDNPDFPWLMDHTNITNFPVSLYFNGNSLESSNKIYYNNTLTPEFVEKHIKLNWNFIHLIKNENFGKRIYCHMHISDEHKSKSSEEDYDVSIMYLFDNELKKYPNLCQKLRDTIRYETFGNIVKPLSKKYIENLPSRMYRLYCLPYCTVKINNVDLNFNTLIDYNFDLFHLLPKKEIYTIDNYMKYPDKLRKILASRYIPINDIFNHLDLKWNWKVISGREDLSYDIIKQNPHCPWNWEYVFFDENKVKIEYILNHTKEKLCWHTISSYIDFNDYMKYPDLPWNYDALSGSKSLNFKYVIEHPELQWNISNMGKYAHKIY
jgi:hypothetical protein